MSGPLVLVADDDDDILLLVTTRLRRDGFEVVSARDGDEALALAQEQRPAVAVLDIGMPGLDGLEVARRIRADDELRGMRVVLLTAKAQESDVRRGFTAGADLYVRSRSRRPSCPAKVRTLVDGPPVGPPRRTSPERCSGSRSRARSRSGPASGASGWSLRRR